MFNIKSLGKVSKYYLALILLATNYIFTPENAQAQIIPDGTLDTQVNLIDEKNIITGGQEAGTNLFHSFKEFSPIPEATTYFNNNSNIETIFSRVTGDIPSLINGIIKTNDASLFLINPSGIIFGDKAQLDINGSFFATTAEQIIFADGTTFSTKISDTKPLLTISMPVGIQYGANPGAIESNGISPDPLEEGEIIALLGGEVRVSGTILSEDLKVAALEIAAVGKNETIRLEKTSGIWKFDYSEISNFQNINIGPKSFIANFGDPLNINLQAENIIINESFIINNNITDKQGGEISLKATNSIQLNQSLLSTQSSGNLPKTPEFNSGSIQGQGGDISLNARTIIVKNGSQITSDNFSEGDGGNINIKAEEYLEISGVGNPPTDLDNPIPSSSAITATVSPTASGKGGNIDIQTNVLNIQDGGRIDSSTKGIGDAGMVNINATDSITISGKNGEFNSGIYAKSSEDESSNNQDDLITGKSGKLNITTSELFLREEGRISVENTEQQNAQRAGEIEIKTDTLFLFRNSKISANAAAGEGGNITIDTKVLFPFNAIENKQIEASSVSGINGAITINEPEIDSKIEPDFQERKPLSPEKSIYSSCGLNSDFTANQFSYIGRGGMSPSPLTMITEDLVGELGTIEYVQENIQTRLRKNFIAPIIPKEIQDNYNSPSLGEKDSEYIEIQEATTWKINDRGNVELIAQSYNVATVDSECPMTK